METLIKWKWQFCDWIMLLYLLMFEKEINGIHKQNVVWYACIKMSINQCCDVNFVTIVLCMLSLWLVLFV